MPPRRRVPRLDEIALVRVAGLVGQGIVELAQRCAPEELHRNVALVKSNVCACVPAPMYDDFAVNVLRAMSRVIRFVEISKAFDYSILVSPVMTIIDRLSIVKLFSEVSRNMMLLVLRNLHELKMLRNIELHENLFNIIYFHREMLPGAPDRQRTWLDKCDLRFVEKLSCPAQCLDNNTFSRLVSYSRLKVLTVYEYRTIFRSATTTTIFDDFGGLSKLREVDLHKCDNITDGIADLLSRNEHLRKLALRYERACLLRSFTIYPALEHLRVDCYAIGKVDLKAIATRFPNLTSLKLKTSQAFDPSVLTAFPHLSSLSIGTRHFPLVDLWALLRKIGHNIVSLELSEQPIPRSDLFFIYKHCRNCENLEISCEPYRDTDPLMVPPFARLKRLNIAIKGYVLTVFGISRSYYLDFTEMPSLEYLEYFNCKISQTRLESMLTDSDNFPRLTQIVSSFFKQKEIEHIQRFIKQHNLDVTFVLLDQPTVF